MLGNTLLHWTKLGLIFKLSQGECISISSLSDIYGTTTRLRHVQVFADSNHDAPAGDQLVNEPKEEGIGQFISNPIAEEEVIALLGKTTKAEKLRGFERIATVLLDDEEFTFENGLLTASLQHQWPSLRKKYETQFLNLYHRKQ
jgi:long-subunit acyl-CoA synthetase (AMP-forming)